MRSLSYTRSVTLTTSIQMIDDLRKQLLLIPLSPQDELQMQWDSKNLKIKFLLDLAGKSEDTTNYDNAFSYLYHHWLVNPKVIELNDIIEFYQDIFPKETLTGDETELRTSLQYIQINPEHPIIQASLAQILFLSLSPFSANNEQFSHLVFLLFMYKYGYDMRRLPVYEEQYVMDLTNYKNMILQSNRLENVTPWLEYVCGRVITALQKTLSLVQQQKNNPSRSHALLFILNTRQQYILDLFNVPGTKISNRVIQKKCKVSQITASRDLAKLTENGLIFAVGKGRSTYYTKV